MMANTVGCGCDWCVRENVEDLQVMAVVARLSDRPTVPVPATLTTADLVREARLLATESARDDAECIVVVD